MVALLEEGPAGSCVAGVAGSLIPPAHEEVDGEARVGTIAQGLMKLEVVGCRGGNHNRNIVSGNVQMHRNYYIMKLQKVDNAAIRSTGLVLT